MPRFIKAARWGALILMLSAVAGCSEYLSRRDGISIYGGDAVAGNQIVQMVDPWPAVAADRQIAYDGTVMRRAVERYHTGRVIAPVAAGTSSAYDSPAAAQSTDPGSSGSSGSAGSSGAPSK
jgi:hypothetical protein